MMRLKYFITVLFTIMCLSGCSYLPGGSGLSTQPANSNLDQGPRPEAATATPGDAAPADTSTEKLGGSVLAPFVLPRISRFTAEKGTPAYLPAFMHAEQGCNWIGVGGQAFDLDGNPITDLVVLLQGSLDNQVINLFALTGTATALGPGGYEFMLANRIVAAKHSLYVSLFDSYGNKLSGDIYFDTPELCESNLVLINFREYIFEGNNAIFLPFVGK